VIVDVLFLLMVYEFEGALLSINFVVPFWYVDRISLCTRCLLVVLLSCFAFSDVVSYVSSG
jgi:hypothetical protein